MQLLTIVDVIIDYLDGHPDDLEVFLPGGHSSNYQHIVEDLKKWRDVRTGSDAGLYDQHTQ
jgi:hypothetical protein